jgi:hypothetical protein
MASSEHAEGTGAATVANVGEYLKTFPVGGVAKYWTPQGEWCVRSLRLNGSEANPNYEVEWVPSDTRPAMRSIMGGLTGGQGLQARFIMEGHRVELWVEAEVQELAIVVDGFHRVMFPLRAPTQSPWDAL